MKRIDGLAAAALAVVALPALAQSFGARDPAFASQPTPAGYVCNLEMAIAPDESVYAELFKSSTPQGWSIARFRRDGTLDPAWGNAGVTDTLDAPVNQIFPLAGGSAMVLAQSTRLMRLDAQGRVDTTYGDAGLSDPVTANGYVHSMALQADGNVLVLGMRDDQAYTVTPGVLTLTRVAPSGRIDAGFGFAGSARIAVPSPGVVYAWSVLPDGSVEYGVATIEGQGFLRPSLHRYPIDFGTSPGRLLPRAGIAQWMSPGVSVDGAGRMVIASSVNDGSPSPRLAVERFTAMGELDGSFGVGGVAAVRVHGRYTSDSATVHPKMLWPDADGSWNVLGEVGQGSGGWAMINVYYGNVVVRVTADGAIDPAFTQGVDLGGWQLDKFVQRQTGELVHADSSGSGCALVQHLSDGPRADATMVEYYHPALDHYFMTLEGFETRLLDERVSNMGWLRTGRTFGAWLPESVPGTTPICRFYGDLVAGPNSHFYTPIGPECEGLKQRQAATPVGQPAWRLEGLAASVSVLTGGSCPPSLSPVFRAYNDGWAHGRESNHRYMADATLETTMQSRGWIGEGAAFCAPPPPTRTSSF